MIAGMRLQSVMHQDFVARIEEAEKLAARCTNEKDRVGWLKVVPTLIMCIIPTLAYSGWFLLAASATARPV